jgi:predicted RNA binding protein YcfA (HicA-like mRNA interferase family)
VSPALPQASGKQVVQALESAGFEHRSTKGSHAKLRHPDGRVVIVPLHRSLARGTLGSILRQAGLSAAEFMDLLG